MVIQSLRNCVVLCAALTALTSCGGGGGGGSPGPTAPAGPAVPAVPTALLALNATNMQDVAAGAMLTGLGAANNLSSQVDGASAMSVALQRLPQTHLLTRIIRQQIDPLTRRRPAALTSHTCDSGGNVDVTQPGPNSVTETFTACSPAPGVTVDGTIALSNVTVEPGVSFSATAAIDLVIKQAGSPDVTLTLTGSNVSLLETINVDVFTFTLSGQELFITSATGTERLGNFTLVATFDTGAGTETDDMSFNYASTSIGGSVNVSTDSPCVTSMNKNFPGAGLLSLTGTGGSKIRVTINGDESLATPQVQIDLDANGDDAFESTLSRNWADLAV